jgi:methylglyoxal synthase
MTVEGDIIVLIFFSYPLQPLPHDPDVKGLLRIAVVWIIPVACDRASADLVFSAHLRGEECGRCLPGYDDYIATRRATQKELLSESADPSEEFIEF